MTAHIGTFRKKPVEVQAVQLTGENLVDVANWCHASAVTTRGLVIRTLEGLMEAELGNYVIRGVQGEFYPCRADIFDATYERVA